MLENIPACLRELPQWVCWKSVPQAKGKPRKVPVCAATGGTASTTDRATWSTFEEALKAYTQRGHAGIGFVFTPDDPFCGIDLDDCLDAEGRVIWGGDILTVFETYTETSPSGQGLKLVFRATKPIGAGSHVKFTHGHTVELYDKARFFALTGEVFPQLPLDACERQAELDAFLHTYDRPAPKPASVADHGLAPVSTAPDVSPWQLCLAATAAMNLTDHQDGSHRLYAACCRCVEYALTDDEALALIREYARIQPFPKEWSEREVTKRLRDAERACKRGEALRDLPVVASPSAVRKLCKNNPTLYRPVIHGLLRQGETMNVISGPKIGKSWFVIDLAIAVATGRFWLNTFETNSGEVLILDNELHAPTSANRIPKVAEARGVPFDDFADRVHVDNLRGRLQNIVGLKSYFDSLDPGRFSLVILDAFYRFMPAGTDENSNADLAMIYSHLDQYANRLGCSFVLIHHASKGNQSGKGITDVGAGAGSQARATDTHLILRPHEETDCVVLDAAVRSWPPIEPRVLRWTFPVWAPDASLDPALLRSERPRRKRAETYANIAPVESWSPERFATEFVGEQPRPKLSIVDAAIAGGLSERKATRYLQRAEDAGLIHRWTFGANRPVQFATIGQCALPVSMSA